MSKDTKIVSLFDRNRENYAQLLMNFIKPVEEEYEGRDLIEIGISAWNTSNMIAEMPENFVDPQFTAAQAGAPEDVLEVLSFLVKRKKKYFAKYDLFIFDYEMLEKTKEISVRTMPLEEYITAVQNYMDDEMPDDIFDGMFDYDFDDDDMDGEIDREAVLIKSKAPVWKYFVKYPEYALDIDDEILPSKLILFNNVYINLDVWLENNYKKIMENLLLDYLDEDQLPKRFSFKKFKTWFDCQFVENVVDFESFD